MGVQKEGYKRIFQLSKLWKEFLSPGETGPLTPHCQYQQGLAAIRSLTNAHLDWFTSPKFGHYSFFNNLGNPQTKKNDPQPLTKCKLNDDPQKETKRNIYQKTPQERPHRPLPRLLYIQNPIVWVSNKLDFRFLRVNWDPLFNEREFTRGARQAISTVTQLVSLNKFDSIKPLLTKNALLNLRRDVEIIWADEVKRNIGLAPEDVQLIIPRKLHFRQNPEQKLLDRGDNPVVADILATIKQKTEKKFCDIDVLFIALKYLEGHTFRSNALAFVDIVARFHRNYSENIPPDWTISALKVRRFNVIPQKSE